MKAKTITLSHPHLADDGSDTVGRPTNYRVERITDSLEFSPGQLLKKSEAAELCDSPRWKVTVVPRA